MRRLNWIILIASIAALHAASAQTFFTAANGSKLWLEGSSNVNSFSCATFAVDGSGELLRNDSLKVSISVSVRSMDCGNAVMNNDMYEAMRADSFPSIRYELISARTLSADTASMMIQAHGIMRIKEVSQRIEMPVILQSVDRSTIRVRGRKRLAMSDFRISPPSALFGLIKANDELTVHFDLIVRRTDGREEAAHVRQ